MQEQVPGQSRCNQISFAILQTGLETISTLSTPANLGLPLPFLLPVHNGVALLTCRVQCSANRCAKKIGTFHVKNQSLQELTSRLGHRVRERKLSVACCTLKGNLLIFITAKSDTLPHYSVQAGIAHSSTHTSFLMFPDLFHSTVLQLKCSHTVSPP